MPSSERPRLELITGEPALAEQLDDLFENAPCGYLSADPTGRVIKVNQTLLSWLGLERDAVLGQRFSNLLTIAGKIYYETHFAPLLRMQGFFNEVAFDLLRADGASLPVLLNAHERRGEDGSVRFVRITVFNATDRRRYELELLDARRQADAAAEQLRMLMRSQEERIAQAVAERMVAEEALRQAQKMEALGQLTGGVAHDFNNLLTVILGGLEAIERQVRKLPDELPAQRIVRSAAMATQGAQSAAALTARLLAFSRQQPLHPKAVNANQLVAGLADLLQRTLGDSVVLKIVSSAGLWRTKADPGELEGALINLAVNGRDAMPCGGQLTIETDNVTLSANETTSLAEPIQPGQYVLIAVRDTGEGIEPDILARVFDPFFTTKALGKGTGLGLSQVYGFVRQSGGHVRILSEQGAGTVVQILLPRLLDESVPLAEAVVAPEPAAAGGAETILLVEDHDALRAYSTGLLTELGYRVLPAPHGHAALGILEREPEVALLFTDVMMPNGMDGRQLATEVRRRRPGMRVLFTSGYTPGAVINDGHLEPGVGLIGKPFTRTALAARVRALLDASQQNPPEGASVN